LTRRQYETPSDGISTNSVLYETVECEEETYRI
jgi:hypothetical protein